MLKKPGAEFHVIQKHQHVAAELPASYKQTLFSYDSHCQCTVRPSWPRSSIYITLDADCKSAKREKKYESTAPNSLYYVF